MGAPLEDVNAHPFGDDIPDNPVKPTYFDPCAGYSPRGEKTFKRRPSDGKYVRTDQIEEEKRQKERAMTPQMTELVTVPPMIQGRPAPPPASPLNVYGCIVAVSRDIAVDGISKSRKNATQGYQFRGIDDVLNALSPLLSKHGLVILPRVLGRSVVERETRNGGVLFYVTVEAEFDFVSAADGSTHTVKTYGEAMDSADKATNKAMSAAYKYAAFQTFCIPTEGDNDADAVTHDVRPRSQAPARSEAREKPVAATVENRGAYLDSVKQELAGKMKAAGLMDDGPDLGTADVELPEGFHLIDNYHLDGDWHQVTWGRDAQGGSLVFKTKLAAIGLQAHNAFTEHMPVRLHFKKYPYLDKVEKLGSTIAQIKASKFNPDDDRFCDECHRPAAACIC